MNNNIIDKIKELTGKTICNCSMQKVLQSYNNNFNNFLNEGNKKDFENLSDEYKIAFICFISGFKLKGKKNINIKKNISTDALCLKFHI